MDWYFGERMETNRAVEKVKKEGNVKIIFKNCVYTHYSVCLFAHLQCVHKIFEDYFNIPFFCQKIFAYNIFVTKILPLKNSLLQICFKFKCKVICLDLNWSCFVKQITLIGCVTMREEKKEKSIDTTH